MTKGIDFYFDFISPYSYLAHQECKDFKQITENIKFNYKPILAWWYYIIYNGITAPAFIKFQN